MFVLTRLPSTDKKKFKVTWDDSRKHKTSIKFGAQGYEDYTTHKDKERWERYIQRHQRKEDWTKSGIYTAGFWSRWILWNKPSLKASIADTKKRFHIAIVLRKN